jgi:hypothetical protein
MTRILPRLYYSFVSTVLSEVTLDISSSPSTSLSACHLALSTSYKTGYHFAPALRSVRCNEFVMGLVSGVLKADVENMIDGNRATDIATT